MISKIEKESFVSNSITKQEQFPKNYRCNNFSSIDKKQGSVSLV